MSLVSINSVLAYPGIANAIGGSITVGTDQTLTTASGHYIATGLVAKEAMTISHVGFRNGAVVGSPTLETRIETVAADGTPSGTLWATNTNATSAALSANSNTLLALTASASITAGQAFTVKLLAAGGTSVVVHSLLNVRTSILGTPWQTTNTSGSAVKARVVGRKIITLGSSSTTFYQVEGLAPGVTTYTAGSFNNTNGARRGLRFQVPFRCRCIGLQTYDAAAVGDYNIALYSDGGSELSSSSTGFDGNYSAESSGGVRNMYFDNPVTLEPATWYRAVIEPSSATNCNMSTITLVSATYVHGHWGGTNQHYTTFASSAWDDTNTSLLPIMDILIDQVDVGTHGTSGARMFLGH